MKPKFKGMILKRAIMTVLVLGMMSGVSPGAEPVCLGLAEKGEALAWLVLGPLPNPGRPHERCEGFDKDWLGGEAEAAPSEGQTVSAEGRDYAWKLALGTRGWGVDFLQQFWPHGSPGVAYAYTDITSPHAKNIRINLGSDDGVKLWVNGKLEHVNHIARGVTPDEDKVDVMLKSGTNRLLFKVDQGEGGWGLMVRLTFSDGVPASDVTQALRLADRERGSAPSRPSTEQLVRAAGAGKGCVAVSAAQDYTEWRDRASLWVSRFHDRALDPDRLKSAIAAAEDEVAAAAATSPPALQRVLTSSTRSIRSAYDHSRSRMFKEAQTPGPQFPDVDADDEDYVRVAPGGRYFTDGRDKPFIPIGYNHNPDWTQFGESNPLSRGYDPAVSDRFFARLKDRKINLIRLMVETPLSQPLLEDPVGIFMPEHDAWLGNIVSSARKYGVRLMVTPWDTFWMNRTWDHSPFNARNGGPVAEKVDFLTKREVIEGQKLRWKHIIDRWGNLGIIFAWELMNEIDIWWGANPDQIAAWTSEMAEFVRDYERKRWGRNHLITVSTAASMPEGTLGDVAFRNPHLDFATTHLYIGSSKAPSEPVGPAKDIHQGVSYALAAITDNRPYLDSENGPIDRWISDGSFDDLVFHNMTWAHFASGGCGSSLRWPYRNPHHISDGMMDALFRLAVFSEQVPWHKISGPYGDSPSVSVSNGWLAFGSGGGDAAIVWLLAETGNKGPEVTATVVFPGVEEISYRAYDTHSGKWLQAGKAAVSDGRFEIKLTGPPTSLAIIVEASDRS